MWRFFLLVVFAVVSVQRTAAEDAKHNLPDNLEIIDPKSLGLSDSDVEKFLGNVKLLPIGGDMGNNVKTQILTVGFEGDEKLDLADFEGLHTEGLPDKDKEVAHAAFSRFQEYFKNPRGAHDFDKLVADSEQYAGTPTMRVTPSTQSTETTTAETTEPVSSYLDSQEYDDQKGATTIEPPPRVPADDASATTASEARTPKYSMSAEEVINLLKLNSNTIQDVPQQVQKFGGFLSGDSLQGRNFERNPAPTAQSQIQSQQSIQNQNVYVQQNEIQSQKPGLVPTFIPFPTSSPTATSPSQQSYQLALVKPGSHDFNQHHQQHQQHQGNARDSNPFLIQQHPSQASPVSGGSNLQRAPQVYPSNQIYAAQPQQPQPTQQSAISLQPQRQPTVVYAQTRPVTYTQQHASQQSKPAPQYTQTHGPPPQPQQQQLASFPQAQPLHSHNFQPPQKFTQNFTPSHGPAHDATPVSPRPGFQVTPSSPMIPISTVENAIHHPPVVRQHLHPAANPGQNVQSEHLDIVAQIARQQHLRISQQPISIPSHPSQAQAQLSGNQQGSQISQEAPKQHQNQQQPPAHLIQHNSQRPSSPVIHQQQPHYQFQHIPASPPVNLNSHSHFPSPQQRQRPYHQIQQHQAQISTLQSQNAPVNHSPLSAPPQQQQQPQRPLNHIQHGPQTPLIPAQPQTLQQQVAHAKPIHNSPRVNLQASQSQPSPVQNPQHQRPPLPAQQQVNANAQSLLQAHHLYQQQRPFQQQPQLLPPQRPRQHFQRPVNTHFPPSPPSRPNPPPSRIFFPTPKNNVFFNDPRLVANGNAPDNSRPHQPQNYFLVDPNYRQNAIPLDSFGKALVPTGRPDPKAPGPVAPALPPAQGFGFSNNNANINSHNIKSSFGNAEARPDRDSAREVRQFASHFGNPHLQSGLVSQINNHNSFVSFNNNNYDDLLSGGSEQSLSITKELFKPDIIESIQPSRMVAYRYLTSSEN